MRQSNTDLPAPARLNFDILRLVCDRLTDVSDVLSFALTSSTLTKPAFQRRLRMLPVNLSNRRFVDSFYDFIFADEAARAPCIYGLKLPNVPRVGTEERTSPQLPIMQLQLVTILQAAVHLKYIHFPSIVDDLDPVLTVAANMASLRELHLVFDASLRPPWRVLGTFRSPLQSLRIESNDNSWVQYDFLRLTLLHDHLANFAPTLEVLELQEVYFDISPSLITTPFTALRSFTTHLFAGFNESTMVALLQLFPNLDDNLVLCMDFIDEEEALDFQGIRECSMEAQRARAWSRLDRVSCDVDAAFLMGLRCPIRRMDLRTYWFDRRVPVSSILRHSCPQLLHFGLPFIKFDPDDLDGFFPSEGVDPLTHLVMFVPCETNHEYRRHRKLLTPWLQFRDKLIASMKHFRLTHLRIVFDYNFRSENDFIARDPANFMGDTDHHAAAIAFFDAIPTLRYLFLTTCGRTFRPHNQVQSGARGIDTTYTWLSSKAWRVAEYPMHAGDQLLNLELGSTKSLIALSEEDAKRVVECEDLSLSSSEKDIVQECGDASTWGD